jgi:uncharacterized Rmd1/YagE family protein
MARQKEYTVEALSVGESIDLKRAEELLKRYILLNRDHPLIIQFTKDSLVALTKFGVVIFWNISDADRPQFIRELSPYVNAVKPHYPYSESVEVFVSDGDKVTEKGIYLSMLDVERIKLVSFAIAQSVALERYEEEAEKHLADLETVITNLKTAGRALIGERDLLKQVGRALAVKQTAISHLALFDKPDEVWESPDLERLYDALAAEFDLRVRFSVLDKKIEFLSENSRMLMEFLAEKRNAFLELVIIFLISIEVIPFAIDFLKRLF